MLYQKIGRKTNFASFSEYYVIAGLAETFVKCMRKVTTVVFLFVRFDRFTRLITSPRCVLHVTTAGYSRTVDYFREECLPTLPCSEPPACHQ